jgi:predicted dehydrogenase
VTDRLRIGVIGGGLIAQVAHIPNLLRLRDKFEVKLVSDPSAAVRAALTDRFGLHTVAEAGDLLAEPLDAVLIAAPDPWHAELCLAAIAAGRHVFCEKPICYGVDELDAIRDARDRHGVVVQIGYMKRLDPAYRAAGEMMAGKGDRLSYISVEVSDPDAWPFVAEHTVVAAADVPATRREATQQRQRAQVQAALGFEPDDRVFRGFTNSYCSALVHDVNAVHGLLDALEVDDARVVGAIMFAGGHGGQASVRLRDHQALWTMAHIETPGIAHYRERIAVYFEDETVELAFASPYLNAPTQLAVRAFHGQRLETRSLGNGSASAFRLELEAFWAAVTQGARTVNPLEEARRDQALLIEMGRAAAVPGV